MPTSEQTHRALRALGIVGGLVALAVGVWSALTPADRPALSRDAAPDLVLITVDTLRADALGAYGHAGAETPRIDALAAGGARFDAAITPFPRTTPALASALTGRWPRGHGSLEVGQPIDEVASAAQVLAGWGYATAAVSGSRVAGPKQGLDRGFDRFLVRDDPPARRLTARALELASEADPDRPLFLWVHYTDPHFPYLPPEDDPADTPCRRLGEQVAAKDLRRSLLFVDHGGLASAALDDCRRLYDGEVAAVDRAVGALLDGLVARGRGGVTILSSDHGEHFGEDALYYEHGPSVHGAALRVPLIAAGPRIKPGVVDAGPASLEDIAPSLLALAGVPAERWPPVDGQDLSARLAGGSPGDRIALAESGSALHELVVSRLRSGRAAKRHCLNGPRYSLCEGGDQPPALYDHGADPLLEHDLAAEQPEDLARLTAAAERWPPEQARERAARSGRFKLVERPRLEGGYAAALYDLAADPAETADVSADFPAEAAALRAALGALDTPLGEAAPRSDETLDALRALGYVE